VSARARTWRGYLAVTAAATLWGISGVLAKTLFNRQIPPWTVIEIRLTAAFVLLLAVLLAGRRPLRVARGQLPLLALLGAVTAGTQFLYYFTISVTDVSTAIFLQYTAPIFVALYGRAVEGERLAPAKTAAIACAVVGSYALVAGGRGIRISPLGLAAGLLSAVAFGVYSILGRGRVRQVGSTSALLYALGSGALLWSVLVPPWQAYRGHDAATWAVLAVIVVFATILPFWLFLTGLRAIPPSAASLTATVEPVVGSIAAYLLLHERLGPWQIAGAALIACGVGLIQAADLRAADARPVMPAPD
jgi:drug/metabolite transporter (DMT)-like permease